MWIKNIFLLFFGLCSGGIIAAGVYAFLAIIGVFVRLIGKTKTKKNIMLYENMIILILLPSASRNTAAIRHISLQQ